MINVMNRGMGILDTYIILRRSGWRSPEELKEAAGRSTAVGDNEMKDEVRWIRSYVLAEDGGVCRNGLYLSGDKPGGNSTPRIPR